MSALRYVVMVDNAEGAAPGRNLRPFILLFAVIAVAVLASAAVVLGEDCSSASIADDWSYDDNTKVLTYSGPVSMPDYKSTDNPILYLDAGDAQSVVFLTKVTKIGDFAFKGSSLMNVELPAGVTSVGKLSFGECHDLKTVILPSGLTSIGPNAFKSCTLLSSISMPSSVTSIGESAFENCTSLRTAVLPSYDAAYRDRTLVIAERTFYSCSSLVNVTIPKHVTNVERYAFFGCSSLSSVIFEEEEITEGGKVVSYSSKIVSIGDYAFMGCSSLRTILLPEMLSTIGEDIFKDTKNLMSIETRANGVNFRSSEGVLFNQGLSILHHYPSAMSGDTYIIPSSVIMIDDTAFNGAKNLQSISIGQSEIYYAEGGILYDLEQKTIVRYPEGRTDSSYTIPGTVTRVSYNAFYGATNLKDLTLNNSTVVFESHSLYIGSYGNEVVINVHAPGDYKVPEYAYNSFTEVKYDGGNANITKTVIIGVCATVFGIALVATIIYAVMTIVKKRR